jgi:simple sugar transport system ATP-binding protein
MMEAAPLLEARRVSKRFPGVYALEAVSLRVIGGSVVCLLGDNGAGKSTLIKILSGVEQPDEGELLMQGKPVAFGSPREALALGIGVVFQDLAVMPMLPIVRNFFLGREPTKGRGPWRRIDWRSAEAITREELGRVGIDVRDPYQLAGTLSGGERQSTAIARAVYFGARLLILDEPTSALGVKEAGRVLRHIRQAKIDGHGVVFITHNVDHAWLVGDWFTVLNRGHEEGTFRRDEVTREQLQTMMAGGDEIEALRRELIR